MWPWSWLYRKSCTKNDVRTIQEDQTRLHHDYPESLRTRHWQSIQPNHEKWNEWMLGSQFWSSSPSSNEEVLECSPIDILHESTSIFPAERSRKLPTKALSTNSLIACRLMTWIPSSLSRCYKTRTSGLAGFVCSEEGWKTSVLCWFPNSLFDTCITIAQSLW